MARNAVATIAQPGHDALARDVLGLLMRTLPSGTPVVLALAGDPPRADAAARVVFGSPGALGRALWPPTPDALGDAYLRGDFEIEGEIVEVARAGKSFDLGRLSYGERAALLRDVLALRSRAGPRNRVQRRARLRGRRHSVARDREAIRFHYDVGNDFYALWLDPRLTYSCAYFATPETDLVAAQEAKLDLICRKLALRPGQRLLDIGCGWGSLIIYAAERYGVEAVGVTLSEKQVREAEARARAVGVAERVRALVLDYRELERLGQFDAVASVGMFEHVGAAQLPAYFAAAHHALKPGALFLNHGIASTGGAEPRRRAPRIGADFVGAHVFPDGELLTVAQAIGHAARSGFELVHAESLRPHYALTLAHWVSRLEAARAAAVELVGDEVYRTWRLYMAGSRVGFERGELDIAQLLLARRGDAPVAAWPLRPWW